MPGAMEVAAAPSCVMTIFGAAGDLTKRLLLPSIYNLVSQNILPDGFRLLGVDKEGWNEDSFRDHISATLKQFWGDGAEPAVLEWLTSRASYQKADFHDALAFDDVKNTIGRLAREGGSGANRLFYLAISPDFIAPVSQQLSRVGLFLEEKDCWSRLIVEKPFGHDLASGKALNNILRKCLADHQIFRIDHFAGKDAIQDLAIFRFSNAIAEPLWSRSMIDNVQITVAETVGLENRAGYYEKSGALRDMVPNHLAEILSLVAMETPVSFSSRHVRDKQVELLASVRSIAAEDVDRYAVRGQYGPGSIDDSKALGYREEKGAAPDSITETYVALHLEVDNWRWAGVPFYLRTGKRLSRAVTEVVVTFRAPPAQLFSSDRDADQGSNRLIFSLQPDPGIQLAFNVKAPGLTTAFHAGSMEFRLPEGPFGKHAKGYERLLYDAMMGEPILFQRSDFVEEGWRIVQPLLDRWSEAPAESFPNYAVGSQGPEAAERLLAANGHAWQSLDKR